MNLMGLKKLIAAYPLEREDAQMNVLCRQLEEVAGGREVAGTSPALLVVATGK